LARSKIINQLKKKNPNINKTELETVLNIFCKSIEKALINEKAVELRGFGSFFVKKIKEKYSARNPKTGELIYIPEKNKIRFKASKKLNKIINE
jgi:integration host factor subunit beta|tara:strand:- start:203 stop:484 length:282 start_codon:yes stop_codon:yes gene_type:complete